MGKTPEITEEEVRTLAMDMVSGTVFTDRHCESVEEVRRIFIVLALMNPKQLKELGKRDIGMVYEHIDKASPRSINGKPCFFSFRTLTQKDTKRVLEEVKKLRNYKKGGNERKIS